MHIRELNHTADIAYRVCVENVDELFEAVVKILKGCLKVQLGKVMENRRFKCSGVIEDDLFDFTNEILYLVHQKVFPGNVEVENDDIVATLHSLENQPALEIKALTYHDLKVEMVNGMFCTTLVFDI